MDSQPGLTPDVPDDNHEDYLIVSPTNCGPGVFTQLELQATKLRPCDYSVTFGTA